MTVAELKTYLNEIPNDAHVIIKNADKELDIEGLSVNSVPSYNFDISTMTGKNTMQLQFIIIVNNVV